MELRWIEDDGRECAAQFPTEAEARRCAEGLRARAEVRDLEVLDDDGEPVQNPTLPLLF